LIALIDYFSDEYFGSYFELDPAWISRDFMEYENMNEASKENDMSNARKVIKVDGGSVDNSIHILLHHMPDNLYTRPCFQISTTQNQVRLHRFSLVYIHQKK
jgi:hypothetical protein